MQYSPIHGSGLFHESTMFLLPQLSSLAACIIENQSRLVTTLRPEINVVIDFYKYDRN